MRGGPMREDNQPRTNDINCRGILSHARSSCMSILIALPLILLGCRNNNTSYQIQADSCDPSDPTSSCATCDTSVCADGSCDVDGEHSEPSETWWDEFQYGDGAVPTPIGGTT